MIFYLDQHKGTTLELISISFSKVINIIVDRPENLSQNYKFFTTNINEKYLTNMTKELVAPVINDTIISGEKAYGIIKIIGAKKLSTNTEFNLLVYELEKTKFGEASFQRETTQ